LNNTQTIVRTTEALLIPPKSEYLVPVMVPSEFGPGLAIIEPPVTLHKLQLALGKFIVSPVNNRTGCKIMNPTNVARFLRRKTPLGVIQNLSIDSDSNPRTDVSPESNTDSEPTLSRCSTLVRNTVVRAMAQVNGIWRFSDPWGSEIPEPMKIKFGNIYCIGHGTPHAKIGLCRVGGLCPA